MSEKILIVEDEVDVAELLAHHLKKAGFVVEMATNGRVALASIRDQPPTLVVLDLMLPEMSGLDLCRAIRSDPRTKEMAVVMLSARTEEIDRVLGFELGADDYVVKPFSPREFVLRIQAILRRRAASPHDHDCLQVGEILLDRSRHEVKAANRVIECTATEFKLLRLLMERRLGVRLHHRYPNGRYSYETFAR
jgi:two-component system, OmpR family, phosphate regulon response regulator PhoB